MKISEEENKRVLDILQRNLHGLSIIDISRISGLNRNKVSFILENLFTDGVLIRSHQYNSKLFALKNPSSIYILLNHIHEPSLIVDEQFRIIRMNKVYDTIYPEDVSQVPGAILSDIVHIPFSDIADSLRQYIMEEEDSQEKVLFNNSGIKICTSIRITLPGDKPGLVLILPRIKKQTNDTIEKDLMKRFFRLFSEKKEVILQENSLSAAYTQISLLVRTVFPEDFSFTLLLDESKQTGLLHTINIPRDIYEKTPQKNRKILSSQFPVRINSREMFRYKSEKIIRIDHIPDIFQDDNIPVPLKSILGSSPFPPLYTTGIILDTSLVAIIGMGNSLNYDCYDEYAEILLPISDLFSLVGEFFRKKDENNENIRKFQAEYRNIYSLLTNKTREDTCHSSESKQYQEMLGTVLEKMGIIFLVTKGDKIWYANQTAIYELEIRENTIMNSSRIDDILSLELMNLFSCLKLEQHNNPVSDFAQSLIEIKGNEWQWYLCERDADNASGLFFYIGEKTPVSLIQYLVLHDSV